MSATADNVAPSDQNTLRTSPLPSLTLGPALTEALSEYPGMQLWTELCQLLPEDVAEGVFMAAEAVVRSARD